MAKKTKRVSGFNSIFSLSLILIGGLVIIWWTPIWVWFICLGSILILIGINIFDK
jgi:MFS superfamily sulfate permease-like transporter